MRSIERGISTKLLPLRCLSGVDELPHKLLVADIGCLKTGRDCPHMKDSRKTKTAAPLAFSLVPQQTEQESLNFVAPTEKVKITYANNSLFDINMS